MAAVGAKHLLPSTTWFARCVQMLRPYLRRRHRCPTTRSTPSMPHDAIDAIDGRSTPSMPHDAIDAIDGRSTVSRWHPRRNAVVSRSYILDCMTSAGGELEWQ